MSESPQLHSAIGKISFWIAVPAFILFLIDVAISLTVVYTPHGGGALSPYGIFVNITFMAIFAANLVGVILALFAFRERGKRFVFPVIGLVLNSLPFLIFFVPMVIALLLHGAK